MTEGITDVHTDPVTVCDHASAAMLITDSAHRLLLIERAHQPHGYAPPAGHVFDHIGADTHDYATAFIDAAVTEVREETGLTVRPVDLSLVLDRWSGNRCSRPLADDRKAGHAWRVFETDRFTGNLTRTVEARSVGWYGAAQVEMFAERTTRFVAGHLTEAEFQRAPGLEPIWVWWLNVLGRLPNIPGPHAAACAQYAERKHR